MFKIEALNPRWITDRQMAFPDYFSYPKKWEMLTHIQVPIDFGEHYKSLIVTTQPRAVPMTLKETSTRRFYADRMALTR
jgi:hypothetical protein